MLSKLLIVLTLAFPSFALQDTAPGNVYLNTNNTVVYRGEVSGESITKMQLALAELATKRGSKSYPIYLVLDSPGGGIIAGDAFIQFAKKIRNLHTVSIYAASMASAIVEAIPGRRYVTANGIMMFHRAKGSFDGQFESGEIESQLFFYKEVVRSMEQRNADRLKVSLETYKEKVRDEYWLYGAKAVAEGVADELVDIVCSQDLIESRTYQDARSLFGSFPMAFSGCPLFRTPVPEQPKPEEPSED